MASFPQARDYGLCMEPHSLGAGGAVGTSDSTVWGRCLSHGLLLAHGHWPQCGCRGGTRLGSATLRVPGCPRSSWGCLHQGFAHQHILGKGSSSSCARGEMEGQGHPRGIGLGFQQPFPTRLLEACMAAPGCLQHPLTLSFALSLSSQLAAGREKQNRLFLRDRSKAEREAGCGTSRAGHGAEAEPRPGAPTRRTLQDL